MDYTEIMEKLLKYGESSEHEFKKSENALSEDVWETYGRLTGNALEALSHRELPWIEARKGYSETER